MTEGTSQGLFVVVAIVIFGIFVGLSYTVFGDTLSPKMENIFKTAIETVGFGDNEDNNSEEPYPEATAQENFEFTFNEDTKTARLDDYIGSAKEVVIPKTVTSDGKEYTVDVIGRYSFPSMSLTKITIPNTIVEIGSQAFQNNQLTELNIPDSVKEIGHTAFSNNKIEKLIIPDSVTEIGHYAFEYNVLKEVKLSENMTSVNIEVFKDNKLEKIVFGSSIRIIHNNAFSINQLKSVTFPDSLVDIRAMAFGNNVLENVNFGDNLIEISNTAFINNNLSSINIPDSVTNLGLDAFDSSVNIIQTASSNQSYFSYKINPDNNSATLTDYIGPQGSNVRVPETITESGKVYNVTVIGQNAFKFGDLVDVKIPKYVTTIEHDAFGNNKIVTLSIPDSVKKIDEDAFTSNMITNVELSGETIYTPTSFDTTVTITKR